MSYDTVPGLESSQASEVVETLQGRLYALIDLQLTLKHIHWNVVGPTFIAVHEMLDTQVGPVRDMTDAVAERIAILGGQPQGTPGALVEGRTWDDYPLGIDAVENHLSELDKAYAGVIEDHRAAMHQTESLDPVTQDLLIGQLSQLEMYQWFVRSHLRNGSGSTSGRSTGTSSRATAERDARAPHEAGRGPTPDEEAAAERARATAPDVSEPYKEYTQLAANAKGEGRV
jgi:starvation-inducible DNA-binding protein